ncbi:ABC transporter ATP-binding protein [Breznakiella homolactica]|uniref:ABC transporter ATP-binding protein n=1 Tax=Breznakiella homolactica TaxID=2798577 RepID=A0A7T7XQ43_9SPIR|nr:ABC transporter ATP-binding protein [Breznakiella homolactica]QQO10421.1 ABC transporter ATP-binding protein [Breznakiella homolactica]
MSVSIQMKDIVKKYGSHTVIPGLDLVIRDGELFTLLGPSGCGKTTLLRAIIGFNTIEGGSIEFDGKPIHHIPTSKRNIGMVFQNYAIFPHMTVAQNVAFGLKNRKVPGNDIQEKVDEILKIVQIHELRDRKPDRMSGGQQQRIALARAIVIHPEVLLLDEPLSNLDAKLRVEMRGAIKDIQHKIGITTVYVTHDQEEALAISDRIAVMNKGIIQQVSDPQTLYQRPANLFVATFIGRSNILDAEISGGSSVTMAGGYTEELTTMDAGASDYSTVKVSVRPEEFIICHDGPGIGAAVADSIFLGSTTHYVADLESGEQVEVIQESETDRILARGAKIKLRIKKNKINVFTPDGEKSLMKEVHNDLAEA